MTSRTTDAFTLIEIVVVLAIVAVIMGMSIPFVERLREDSLVESAAENIGSIIKEARSSAISDHAAKLVVINDTDDRQSGGAYYGVKIYQEGKGTIVDWHKLPKGLSITQSGFTTKSVPYPDDAGEAKEKPIVEFSPTGNTEQGGEIVIASSNDASRMRRITVSTATGKVKVGK
ncbi:MAG: prepilin-type N-terminal cleavage/methylation domain-containing protein [Candidatus Omnitrophica bacterium]|nr:prepilin-type N-terminal cleavage/methylation domain-containing protein [Candidatus Omnitrophota bacterium]